MQPQFVAHSLLIQVASSGPQNDLYTGFPVISFKLHHIIYKHVERHFLLKGEQYQLKPKLYDLSKNLLSDHRAISTSSNTIIAGSACADQLSVL